MFVCLSFIGGQTVGWNEMKLGMSDPWDVKTDIGRSSSRSKVTGVALMLLQWGSYSSGVALMTEYNEILTSNEDQKQYLLQVVSEHRRKMPTCKKELLHE